MEFSRRLSLKALAATAATQFARPTAFAAAPTIRLIVLDVGGTIIQDRGEVPDALQGAFAKRGITVTPEEIALWRGASKREVVRHFAGKRSTASSTGFGHEVAASIFHRLGWERYFAAMITSDDVDQGRPAPYMIFHAMEAARVANVAEVIAVGDTPLDLQAGTNAGVRGVVGVLSGASKEDRLRPEPHTDILSSVAELPALIASKY